MVLPEFSEVVLLAVGLQLYRVSKSRTVCLTKSKLGNKLKITALKIF